MNGLQGQRDFPRGVVHSCERLRAVPICVEAFARTPLATGNLFRSPLRVYRSDRAKVVRPAFAFCWTEHAGIVHIEGLGNA